MTNQSSDTQPALHSHNVSVRAGRLTKFKGRVASIAPGLSVVATAAVLLTGGVEQAAAQAATACGGDNDNDGVIKCTADTYADGITYNTSGDLILELDNEDILAVGGAGARVLGDGTANVEVRMKNVKVRDKVTNPTDPTGPLIDPGRIASSGHGLEAQTYGTGSVRVQLDGVAAKLPNGTEGHDKDTGSDIIISRNTASALRARIDNADSTAEATALMTGGKVTIADGTNTAGVSAFTGSRQGRAELDDKGTLTVKSGGDVTAELRDGFIHTKAAAQGSSAVHAGSHQTGYIGTVTASMSGGEIHNENRGGLGVRATSRSSSEHAEAIAHMSGGKITATGGGFAFAVNATYGGNDNEAAAHNLGAHMVAKISGGIIETETTATAVRARNTGVGNATAEINQVDGESFITTGGNGAHGLRAASDSRDSASEGVATALVKAGTITLFGPNSVGADSQANGGKGKALTRMEGGSITTHGSYSYGLEAQVDNPDSTGVATVEMTGGTIVTGEVRIIDGTATGGGGNSHGILAHNSGSGDIIVDMSVGNGTITTKGGGSHGIYVEAQAQADGNGIRSEANSSTQARAIVKLGTFATVTAEGRGSDGIRISGNEVRADANDPNSRVRLGAQGFDIVVAGTVKGNAAAIRTISSKAGEITIVSGANVIAEGGGIAIRTETAAAGGDGVPRAGDDGTAVIRSAGTITGNIELAAGNDKLIVTGGSITGNVYGGAGDNTLNLAGRRFTGDIRLVAGDNILEIEDGTFTGGIYGGEGDDTVTIFADTTYVGPHVLNGGAGDNDRLTLHGKTISNTTDNFLNWESVTLNDTDLSLSGVTTVDMDLSIDAGSTFRAFGGEGGMTIAGDKVTNAGDLTLSVQDGTTGDEIRVEGNYTGSDTGSDVFALDARMDGTDTDRLHFTGDVSGDMEVLIASVGSAGATGGPLEIYVVSVDGEADDATFTLMNGNYVMSDGDHGVLSGAYVYRLAEVETQDGRNWWALSARSESGEISWGPTLPTYDSYGQALLALNGVSSLRNRGRSQDFRSLAWDGGTGDQNNGTPLWVQMGAKQASLSEEHSTTRAALDSSLWEMEIGGDIVLSESGAGLLVGGLVFSYGTGSTDVSSDFGGGSIDTSGLSLGVTATWYDARRFYVDGQFKFASYSSDLDADRIGSLTEGNGGTGYALSIEAGQQLDLGSRLTVIPQAQLSFSSVAFDDFTSEAVTEERVTLEDASSQQLRLGLEFGPQDQGASGVYGIVNLYHEFGAGSEVTVAGATLTTESEPWAVEVGIGGTYAWSDRVDFFGEASYATGLSNAGDTSALSASAGIKVMF